MNASGGSTRKRATAARVSCVPSSLVCRALTLSCGDRLWLPADGFWLATKGNCRKVQGRLNDLGMLLACHAVRDDETGAFTPDSEELLESVARWCRLYHMVRARGPCCHAEESTRAATLPAHVRARPALLGATA